MPTVNKWEDWDDLEDKSQEEIVRKKINHKSKVQNKKDWEKVNERIQSDNGVKYIKNKRK
jgi:hypothetical protein|tara:strand:- start:839 stop:1018 length:180 start_codon:yes stop_codon:yes gene_type:complete